MCLEKTKPLFTLQSGLQAVNSLSADVTADYRKHILPQIPTKYMEEASRPGRKDFKSSLWMSKDGNSMTTQEDYFDKGSTYRGTIRGESKKDAEKREAASDVQCQHLRYAKRKSGQRADGLAKTVLPNSRC